MKIFGTLFALVLVASLVLIPAAVSAQDTYDGLANCAWDKVKWQDNENSWHLYLQHWGKTPIQAMTRLRGLCGPDTLCAQLGTNCPDPAKSKIYGNPNACYGGCPACRTVEGGSLATCSDPVACEKSMSEQACAATGQPATYECPSTPVQETELPTCGFCWGVSLAFADKSWSGATIGNYPRINDQHPNHFGVGPCPAISTSADTCYGGGKGGDWGVSGAPHTECCALTWALQDNLCANPLANK